MEFIVFTPSPPNTNSNFSFDLHVSKIMQLFFLFILDRYLSKLNKLLIPNQKRLFVFVFLPDLAAVMLLTLTAFIITSSDFKMLLQAFNI